ncbi:hypothetical protein IWQ47_002705 [Aquimarina sp. EL_43]|uniref:hypothetical protein n=1 Tax=Aquimarina TaxID=290174 RepID=UPI000470FF7B|nr:MULTISPECIES: hypothetical protein [Aquimarina]MBG6131426.1 hypothetical protein [Aquimarina sp. EL_35]MBG6151691.1 hypothetical protein [Aquimarina sp. EL_32]MBG6169621.1 hypothetical protein [Aquimarina sp. EL_43]
MIDKNSFNNLKKKYYFLSDLPDKLQGLISDELSPNSNIIGAYEVMINDKNGCILLLENKLLAFWMSKILFKKFPTLQEFDYAQINEVKNIENEGLYIHSSADLEILNEDYEEGKFIFESSAEKDEVAKIITSKSSRLK